MKATREQIEAFDYYYRLGKHRSLVKVAQEYHRSQITIKRWSAEQNWKELVRQRDGQIGEQIIAKTDKEIMGIHEMNREILTTLVRELLDKVREGRLQIHTISDWKRVMEIQQLQSQFGAGSDDGNMESLAAILDKSAQMIRDRLDGSQNTILA